MHRSGTSALTRCLNLLGATLPGNLIPPQADNPTGFWESTDVQKLNDELLEALSTRWDDDDPIRWNAIDNDQRDAWIERIRDLVDPLCKADAPLVLKDPRLCRLLPLWQTAFEQLCIDARYVIPFRDPREVSASLAHRNGLPDQHGQRLWLRYVLDAEQHTRGHRRVIVPFVDLLEEPLNTLETVWRDLGLREPVDWVETEAALRAYLQPELRHERAGDTAIRDTDVPVARLAYQALLQLASDPGQRAAEQLLDEAGRLSLSAHASLEQDRAAVRSAQAPWRIQTADHAIDDGRFEIDEAHSRAAQDAVASGPATRFSIVMPTWNRRDSIAGAIDSVIAQSYPHWELIICDDGSDDDTVDYLQRRYAQWLNAGKIRCIACTHAGVSAARNIGLRHANGPWITYLDSDNHWHRDYLLILAGTVAKEPHRRSAYGCLRVHEAGSPASYIRGRSFDWERLRRGNFIDINVFAHHNDLWVQLGGFDEALHRLEDWDLILRYTRLYPPAFIPLVCCDYYLSPSLNNLSLREALDTPYALVRARFSTRDMSPPAPRGLEIVDQRTSSDMPGADTHTLVGSALSDAQLQACADHRAVLRCNDPEEVTRTVASYTDALAAQLDTADIALEQSRRWAQRALARQRMRLRRTARSSHQQKKQEESVTARNIQLERDKKRLQERLTAISARVEVLEGYTDWARQAHARTIRRLAAFLPAQEGCERGTRPSPSAPGAAGFRSLSMAARRQLGAPLNPRAARQIESQCRSLLASGLFDTAWYAWRYPDLASWPHHPIWHWILRGCNEGRQPNAFFDPRWYVEQHPDVAQAAYDPLLHYLRHGAEEGRLTSPLFDRAWYLAQHPDVLASGMDPLQHYLRHGRQEGRGPHPLIHPRWYLAQYPELSDLPMDAVTHFLLIGGDEGRSPGPDFDSSWYLSTYADVRAAGLNPLIHYLYHGQANGRSATPRKVAPSPSNVVKSSSLASTAHRPEPVPLQATAGRMPIHEDRATVLLCAHSAGSHLFGGERSFLELLRLLEGMPYNVVVTLPRSTAAYREAVRARCCEVIELPYQFWSQDTEPDRDVIAQLQTIILTRRIDLVHVNTIMIREPLIAAARLGIPGLVHVRESVHRDRWLQERIGLPAAEIIAQVQATASAIIANSEASATEFGDGARTYRVPNTFDLEALDLPPACDGGVIHVGLISSNLPKKGIEDFARIAQACEAAHPQARFLLIGPDNEHIQALRERQSTGELPDNLVFAGYAEQPEAAIAQLDIVMNLSHFSESFGRTVAEGLAARRPAIVYDLGAPKSLVQHDESGFVVPLGDWRAAAAHVIALLQSPQRIATMGEKGRAFIAAHFDADAGREALSRVYGAHLPEQPACATSRPLTAHADARFRTSGAGKQGIRLAYFCWHFPVPSETFVLSELRALVRAGHDIRVFCRHSPHPDFSPDFEIEWQSVESPEALAEALRASGREHVHAHFTYPTVTDMVWPACEQANIPFTFIAHAQDIFRHENDQKNRVGDVVRSPLCRAVFTLGRFHRDYLLARGVPAGKIIINPNAVEVEDFPFLVPSARPPREGKSVCAIHRLTEKKGLHHLLTAAKLLAAEEIGFHIYGYGDQEDELTARIAQEGLTNVQFDGPLRGAQAIVDTLRRHDLFAAPSIRTANGDMDGIPTSVVEAMAAGTPVITTDVASIPDLVQDGITGILVPSDDATALAEGIRRFFRLSPEQVDGMARSARQVATARHDVGKLIHVLRRVWEHQVTDIVIVSWNNLLELREVVGRLFDFTRTPFHLTIADNGSDSDVIAYLNHLQLQHDNVTVVFNDANHFVGPGTNIAAQQGQGDTIVYVCGKEGFALQEGWETELTYYMEQHPEVGLAGTPGYSPSYLFGRDLAQGIPTFSRFRNQNFAQENPDRAFFHIQGGLFAIRRQTLNDIGGFSEAVPHAHTDVEYSYFVESCGWQLGVPPHMLALFSKTLPDYWTRIDETVRICHPPRLQDLPQLDRLAARAEQRCPQCGWQGSRFSETSTLADCPQCGITDQARFQLRVLASSPLTHRAINLTALGLVDALPDFWSRHFSRAKTHQIETLGALLDLPPCSQDAICLDLARIQEITADKLLDGCAHALKEQGAVALVFGADASLLETLHNPGILSRQALKVAGMTVAGSWVAGHAAYPVVLIQQEADRSAIGWPLEDSCHTLLTRPQSQQPSPATN